MRDPELKLSEIADMQDEVATLLAFGGPAAAAAKAVGVTLTVDGVVPKPDAEAAQASEEPAPATTDEAVSPDPKAEPEADAEAEPEEPATDSEEEPLSDSGTETAADESSTEPTSH